MLMTSTASVISSAPAQPASSSLIRTQRELEDHHRRFAIGSVHVGAEELVLSAVNSSGAVFSRHPAIASRIPVITPRPASTSP